MFGKVQSIVVAVPGEEAAPTELGCQMHWRMTCDAHRYRGTTSVEALRIADAVKLESRNLQEPGDEASGQKPLVLLYSLPGREQLGAAAGEGWIEASSQLCQVVHAGDDPADAFVVQRAPLPVKRDRVGIGRDFVGLQAAEMLIFAVQHAHVRTEEFVSGAHQEVAIERAHVNGTVWRVVHRIDIDHGSYRMRQANNLFHVVDGSDRVRGVANRDDLGAAGDLPCQVIHVEGAILVVNFSYPHGDALFLQS